MAAYVETAERASTSLIEVGVKHLVDHGQPRVVYWTNFGDELGFRTSIRSKIKLVKPGCQRFNRFVVHRTYSLSHAVGVKLCRAFRGLRKGDQGRTTGRLRTRSAGAEFKGERSGESYAADGDGYRNRDMPVGVAHVGLDSSEQAIGYETDNAEQQAETHTSGGEEEGGEEDARRGTDGARDRAGLTESLSHSLQYIKWMDRPIAPPE